jgi:C4-dicarboxylate-specific signal transduction histidine kinase
VAARMFEPFFATKSGGMGMGLAIKDDHRGAGGSLTALPNTPQGMEFQVVLPRCRHK